MESSIHLFSELFRQLGMASDRDSIDRFIATHRPLASERALSEAPFWTPAQADFLRSELGKDADWAELIDQLNARLR